MGSWMMFFENLEDLDQKWKVCGKLYDEGKLIGIQSLKFSKDYKSVRSDEHGKSVIFFFVVLLMIKQKFWNMVIIY